MDLLCSKEIEWYNPKMGKEEREPVKSQRFSGFLQGQASGFC